MATNLNISENQERVPLTVGSRGALRSITPDDGSPYYVGARAYVTQTASGAIVTVIDKEGTTTATILNGQNGQDGQDGADGADGNGIADISLTGSSANVDEYTITYDDGTTETFYVTNGIDGQDGADGADGADGYSPTATVTKSGDTATITITDKDGTTTASISDGSGGASAFVAEFGTTTYADVKDAYDDDAILICTVPDSGNTMVLQLVYFDDTNEIFFFAFPTSDGWYWTQLSNADGWDDGQFYFASTDVATQLRDGLMSALDKQKLDGLSKRNIWYGTCSTGASQSPKTITTASGDFELTAGNMLCVLFSHTNSLSSVSLQVDGGASKSAYSMDGTSDISNRWGSNEVVMFAYDGTKFTLLEQGLASTTQYGITKLNNTVTSTSTSEAATANAVKSAYDHGGVTSVNGSTGAVTVTVPTITDTYDGTSSNGMSGKAVKSAIDALDGTVSGSAGSGKTLTAFSQTDGKVSATFGNISITKSQVSDFPTIPTNVSDLNNDSGFTATSITRYTTTGTNIADLTIDGTTTKLYAPTGGGGGGITDVTVDGTSVVTGTTAAIDLTGKSDVGHTHTTSAITDFPIIPSNTSDLNNDSDFITSSDLPTKLTDLTNDMEVGDFINDAGYITSPSVPYLTCSTAAGTAAKVATLVAGTLPADLPTGLQVTVKFTNSNSIASPTLQVGSLTAKSIKRYGTTAPSTSAVTSWNAGNVITFVYDGQYWQMADWTTTNTTYSTITDAEYQAGTSTSSRLVTPARLKGAILYHAPSVVPTNVSDFTNDAGYITGYTETDPVFSASAASGITSSNISTWNGKYTKPSTGIPKEDLASAVQTSLGKADSALQSFTETDPVFSASAASGITSSDISTWNGKSDFSGDYTDLTNAPADYITEQGTSGIWTYRKWNSGIAECWGEKSWTISSWTSWGGTYYSTYSGVENYPTNLFIAKPTVTADGNASTGDGWLASRAGATHGGTKDHTASYFIMRASNGTNNITGYAHIHAIGTWK